jgi:hypothetical protein
MNHDPESKPLENKGGFSLLSGAAVLLGLLGILFGTGYLMHAFSWEGKLAGLDGVVGISAAAEIFAGSFALIWVGLFGRVILDVKNLLQRIADRPPAGG